MIPYLLPIVRAVMVGAAVLAVLLARRVPAHRPVAVFLVAQTGVMLGRWALLELYLRGAIAAAGGDVSTGAQPAVLYGWARVAGIAMNAGWLMWPAGLAMLALWSVLPMSRGWKMWINMEHGVVAGEVPEPGVPQWMLRRPWSIRVLRALAVPAALWLVAVAFIAATYPEGRPLYPKLFAGAQLASLLVGIGTFAAWQLRGWGRASPSFSQACVLGLLVCDAVSLAGPMARGLFSTWYLSQSVDLVEYVALILAQGGFLWTTRSR